jgi:hypothetical protein
VCEAGEDSGPVGASVRGLQLGGQFSTEILGLLEARRSLEERTTK